MQSKQSHKSNRVLNLESTLKITEYYTRVLNANISKEFQKKQMPFSQSRLPQVRKLSVFNYLWSNLLRNTSTNCGQVLRRPQIQDRETTVQEWPLDDQRQRQRQAQDRQNKQSSSKIPAHESLVSQGGQSSLGAVTDECRKYA